MAPDGSGFSTAGAGIEWHTPTLSGPAPSVMSMEALMQAIPDPVFVHDHSGRFLEVNDHACESLGYTRTELLKLNVMDIERDFDLEKAQAMWNTVKPNGRMAIDGHHKRKDGTVFPVRIHFGLLDYFGHRLYIGVVREAVA